MDTVNSLSKTADVIFEEIKSALKTFDVSQEQLQKNIFWTTDRGGNIRSAISNCKRLNCYAHLINNIVKHMCKSNDAITIVKDASALVKFMKTSGLNSKLKNSLKAYAETRWNTVYDCITSIKNNYSAVMDMIIEKERDS